MQDSTTGDLVKLDPKFLAGIETLSPFESRQRLQDAMDDAQPDRTRQGPVFTVGEEIEIRGGRFRVHAISQKRIYLDSLPGKPKPATNLL